MAKRAIVCVTNDLSTDQRVQKHATLLLEQGFEVTLVGRLLPNSANLNLPYKTQRFKLLANKGALFYAFYNIRLFYFLLISKCDLIFSNDLDTLPASYLASKLKGCKLIYDSHEYFLGVPEIQHKKLVKLVWLFFEQNIFPKLKYTLTVNSSIALLYKKDYGVSPRVMRNIPSLKKFPAKIKSRKELGLPENAFIVIMQGAGINMNRGAEEFILSLKYTESNVMACVIGHGDVWDKTIQLAKQEGLSSRILFISRLPYEEMIQYTYNANLGVTLDKPGNPNYENSLPNKIFDYAYAGIPVIGSNLREVSKTINEFQIGSSISSVTPESIANAINYFLHNQSFYNFCKENTTKLKEQLSWEKESIVLTDILKEIER